MPYLLQESIPSGFETYKANNSGSVGKLTEKKMEPPYEEQYNHEGSPSAYMTMRDYRNLAWQNQQPWERNPNPPRSMREYRDQ